MRKRGQNEGTIYRRSNGTWCAQVTLPNGKRLSKYAKTQRECREWLTEQMSRLNRGIPLLVPRISLVQYLEHWLSIVQSSLRPNTCRQYARVAKRHVIPLIGHVPLGQLRPDHLQHLYSTLLEAGVGTRTIRLVHSILHRALHQAVRWDLVGRNVADSVSPPRLSKREMQTLSPAQVRALLTAANDSRYCALYHLAVTTGLRCAELLGLRWDDLDTESGTLQVQRQLYRETGQGLVFREPKSASGRRVVMLSRRDLVVLASHRRRQLEERLSAGGNWQDNNLIFSTASGTPVDQRNMTRDFKRCLSVAGLPNIRFHDLRHTAASLMLAQGIHPKVVQERLGHADISLTLNTYSHVLPTIQREAAEAVAALLE